MEQLCNSQLFLLLLLMVFNNILAKLLHKLFTPATYTYTFMINESEIFELVRNMTSGPILPVFDVLLVVLTQSSIVKRNGQFATL